MQAFTKRYGFDPSYLPHELELDMDEYFVVIHFPDGLDIVIEMDGEICELSDNGHGEDALYKTIISSAKFRKECEELREERANLCQTIEALRRQIEELELRPGGKQAKEAEIHFKSLV